MAAKDKYHEHIKEALKKDGWDITDAPYIIETEGVNFLVDLAAEKMIAAQKDNKKIAVEIKSFLKESTVSEFHTALGQFLNYQVGLTDYEVDRKLYLALPHLAFNKIQKLPSLMKSIKLYNVRLIVFDVSTKTIVEWKN